MAFFSAIATKDQLKRHVYKLEKELQSLKQERETKKLSSIKCMPSVVSLTETVISKLN